MNEMRTRLIQKGTLAEFFDCDVGGMQKTGGRGLES